MSQQPHTEGEETRLADVVVYLNGRKTDRENWDSTLLIDSWSDLLSLTAPELKDKYVRVIKKSNWLKGKRIEPIRLTCRVCGKPMEVCMGDCDIDKFLELI